LSKKNIERLVFGIFALCVVAFLMIAPYFLLPQINSARNEWLKNAPNDAIFLELWEIDTFEGGSASRARFLEKRAFEYQTKSKNAYVIVRTVELEQAKNLLSQGARPDMVSFGIGAGDTLRSFCKPIGSVDGVRGDLLAGGRSEGELLAVPWCMGGYVLCSKDKIDRLDTETLTKLKERKENKVIGVGQAYNLPKYAMDKSIRSFVEMTDFTQYQAYETYLSGNEFEILLGTQRDLFRLNNKSKLGLIDSVNYHFLGEYTDLIQYMAITTEDERQADAAKGFLNFLVSETVQKKLTTIGMFCVNNDKIYSEKVYQQFEEALSNKLQVMNVFVSNVWLKEEQAK